MPFDIEADMKNPLIKSYDGVIDEFVRHKKIYKYKRLFIYTYKMFSMIFFFFFCTLLEYLFFVVIIIYRATNPVGPRRQI